MLLWRGALAVGVGCCIVFLSVAYAPTAVAFTAPPLTAAILLGTMALAGARAPRAGRGVPTSDLRTADDERALLRASADRAAVTGRPVTLVTVRMEGLEDVEDTLGTAARDSIVAEAQDRVAGCAGPRATVVRLGVDELAALLPGGDLQRGSRVAEQILRRLREPVTVADVSVVVPGSIGLALQPAGAVELDRLLREASLAMHQAVAEGGNRLRVYHPQMLQQARERLSIESELRQAVARGELCVYYQPIIDTRSGRVRSVEALVRWNHPTLGLLTPPQFLGAAERIGLMVEVGRQVLDLACAQVAQWRRRWPDLAVAVNVSQAELVHPEFAGHVLATLRKHRLPTSALHLEVTETIAVGEDSIATALEPLAAAGIDCSLDDFGTGHSSLHRLRRLPVARLKIDKSFVAEVGGDQANAPLLASIVSLAHSVGHCVVAEGVETSDQAAFLAEQGCDELQGYLFSRPVPAADVAALLEVGTVVVPPSPPLASVSAAGTASGALRHR